MRLAYRILIFSCFLGLSIHTPAASAEPVEVLTLHTAYDYALTQSEQLKQRTEDIRAAEARYREAIAAIYPLVDFSATQRFRNSGGASGTIITGDVNNNVGSSRSRSKHPFESSLGIRQPLFTGFREQYLSEAVEAEIRALEHERVRNREILFEDVANVFYQTIFYEKDLEVLGKARRVFEERIAELRDYIRLGKSRDSEIQAAMADIADLGATTERVRGLMNASRELLSFLVGKPAGTFSLSAPMDAVEIPKIDPLLERAKNRADIRANMERVVSAQREAKARERERWPNVALEGNYYPYEDPDTNRDWEVLFRFDVPLYEGGRTQARVDQVRARERAAVLAAQERSRIAEREIRTLHGDANAVAAEIEKLKALMTATQKNYQAQRRDYELGVVTNLEVLAAIRNQQDAERRLLDAQTSLRTTLARLEVAAGGIS